MSELSYEELKTKFAELQKKLPEAGDSGSLSFKISAKAASARTGWALSSHALLNLGTVMGVPSPWV